MSEDNFREDIELLEYLSNHEQTALIESDKISIKDDEDNWVSLATFGVSQIPITFYVERIEEDNQNKIKYKLNYRLLAPKMKITPKKEEYLILSRDNKGLRKNFHSTLNEEYEEDNLIRYDNEGINTFSKAKTPDIVLAYIAKSGDILHGISSIIANKKVKVKNKVVTRLTS